MSAAAPWTGSGKAQRWKALTMMTGTTHFIIRSGRRTAMAEIPT